MLSIDWERTPMYGFRSRMEEDAERGPGFWTYVSHPLGNGQAQGIMRDLADSIGEAYANLLPVEYDEETQELDCTVPYLREITDDKTFVEGKDGDPAPFEGDVEVPVIRDGCREYERLDSFTLADLPAILDTLVVLEEEQRKRDQAEKQRKAEERKRVKREQARERRKLQKLGEWH
jgi:hypothetical protein